MLSYYRAQDQLGERRGIHGRPGRTSRAWRDRPFQTPTQAQCLKQLNYSSPKAFLDTARRALQHIKSFLFCFFAQLFFDRGSAGTAEELGGLRGLHLYMQRVALQGSKTMIERLVGKAEPEAQ